MLAKAREHFHNKLWHLIHSITVWQREQLTKMANTSKPPMNDEWKK